MNYKHNKNPFFRMVISRYGPRLRLLANKGLRFLASLQRMGVEKDIRWTRQFAARMVRVFVLAGMSMPMNQIAVRASALTYTTILSVVPVAVILSAVAGQFGYLDLLSQLVISLASSLNLDVNLEPILAIIKVAQKVDFQRLGLVGSLGLLVTFYLSMSNIEMAMDEIWDIRKKRNWWGRIKEFTPFLFLVVLLFLGVGHILLKYHAFLGAKFSGNVLPGFIHGTIILISSIVGISMVWLGLFMVFFIVPNTKVRIIPAVLAASLSTTGIYFLSRALVLFPHIFFSKNNFIYGSLAIFPAALLMVYLIWLIILYCATVGFVYQRLYHPRGRNSESEYLGSPAFHRMEKDVIAVLRAIHFLSGSRAMDGRSIVTLEKLKSELWDDAHSIEALAAPLIDLKLLAKRKINSGAVFLPRCPMGEVDLTALHNLLLRLDPKDMGKLKTLTALDDLKYTLRVLYSSGKKVPPLYMASVVETPRLPSQ